MKLVTNPCFEFWLLLHYDQVLNLNRDMLLENPKVSSKRRYTEHELRKLLKGYSKNNYDAELLIGKMAHELIEKLLHEKSWQQNLL